MKKTLAIFMFFIGCGFYASEPAFAGYVQPHEAYTQAHVPYMQTANSSNLIASNNVSSASYSSDLRNHNSSTRNRNVNVYAPTIRVPAIISSGTNYISRDIATGEIKQVVQVGPPRAYGGYYY